MTNSTRRGLIGVFAGAASHQVLIDLNAHPFIAKRFYELQGQRMFSVFDRAGNPTLDRQAFILPTDSRHPVYASGSMWGLQRLHFDHGRLARA